MIIDERIEALTQSTELLSSFHRDMEAKFDARFSKLMEVIERLAHIVENH